jgi:hypothetical protein
MTARNLTHGRSFTRAYGSWSVMLKRCLTPAALKFPDYGGRGITVCERWLSFENFLADMGAPPAGTTIDRIDNDGPYEPANCRWATSEQQARNRSDSRLLTHDGTSLPLCDWAKRVGLHRTTIAARLGKLGWPVERALTERPR